jgi:hypothetical protein
MMNDHPKDISMLQKKGIISIAGALGVALAAIPVPAHAADVPGIVTSMLQVIGWFFDFMIPLGAAIFTDLMDPVFKLGAALFLVSILIQGMKLMWGDQAIVHNFFRKFSTMLFGFILFSSFATTDAYKYLVDYFYVPAISMGFDASSMILERSNGITGVQAGSVGFDSVGCSAYLPPEKNWGIAMGGNGADYSSALAGMQEQRVAFLCQIGVIMHQLSFGITLGALIIPDYDSLTEDVSGWSFGWWRTAKKVVLFVSRMTTFILGLLAGLLLIIVYGFVLLSFPIYVMMMLFKLFIMMLVAPFAFYGFIFDQVKPLAGRLVRGVISVAVVFMGWAAVIGLGMSVVMIAIDRAMTHVVDHLNANPDQMALNHASNIYAAALAYQSAPTADKLDRMQNFMEILPDVHAMVRVAIFGINSVAFWMVILAAILIYVLMKAAQAMAEMLVNSTEGVGGGASDIVNAATKVSVAGGVAATYMGWSAVNSVTGAVFGRGPQDSGKKGVSPPMGGPEDGHGQLFGGGPSESQTTARGLGAMAQSMRTANAASAQSQAGQAAFKSSVGQMQSGIVKAGKGTTRIARGVGVAKDALKENGLGRIKGLVTDPNTRMMAMFGAGVAMAQSEQGLKEAGSGFAGAIGGAAAAVGGKAAAASAKLKAVSEPVRFAMSDEKLSMKDWAAGAQAGAGDLSDLTESQRKTLETLQSKPVAATVMGMRYTAQTGKAVAGGVGATVSGLASGAKKGARNSFDTFYGRKSFFVSQAQNLTEGFSKGAGDTTAGPEQAMDDITASAKAPKTPKK